MSKKSIGTGITRLLFGLKGKDLKVIPFNEMSPQQFEELDRFLGKLGFILSSNEYTLTKQQANYVINQIKQLDLYRERIMPGKNPDFKDFIPRDNLGIPGTDKAREFKGFEPRIIQGGKSVPVKFPKNVKKDMLESYDNLFLKGEDTKYDADVLATDLAERRGFIKEGQDSTDMDQKKYSDLYSEAYSFLTQLRFLNRPPKKPRPGKINYDKMSEFLGVKLRGDETFEELLEIEKRMKNKDPEDFAGGGLATAIAKIKGKYGKKAIMKGKVKKKSEKQKRREMFEEFNKRNKEREEFIFGGGVGYKGILKLLAKRQNMKPSDILKKGNPKSQVPRRIKPLLSDKEKLQMKEMRVEQLEAQLDLLKTNRSILANRENFPPQFREISDDLLNTILPSEVRESLKGSTIESLDKEILQIENVLKNLKIGKDKRALNADGGLATMFRPRLKDGGPPNPGRRTFLKLMAGLASLPIVGKLFKPTKIATVVPLKNTTTTMPDWFPQFVDRMITKNVGSKIDADVMLFKDKDLPGVELYKYDDGRIEIQGKNAYDSEYDINYTPPGIEVLDYKTGKSVKTPGDFQASDTVYRQSGPEPGDYDVDGEIVDDIEDILGGNSTQLEGYAKGTGEVKYTKGQYRIDEADARLERADEVELPDPDIDAIEEANEGYAKGGLVTMFRKK